MRHGWFLDKAKKSDHHGETGDAKPHPSTPFWKHYAELAASGIFNPHFYLSEYPDVAEAGIDPLEHYIRWGQREGRRPSDRAADRVAQNARAAQMENGPVEEVVSTVETFCLKIGHSPANKNTPEPYLHEAAHDPNFWGRYALVEESGLFDPEFYRLQVPSLDSETDPLAHYLIWGYRSFVDPSELFSGAEYQIVNPDVQRAGINPLVHYLYYGRGELRQKSFAEREEKRKRSNPLVVSVEPAEEIELEWMRG